MRRRSPIQLDVKHERWLVSYSDFVTLLFAFFVVMYSISQVSEGKYRVLSSTLLQAFSVPQSAINPIQVGDPTLSTSPSAIEVQGDPEPREIDSGSQTQDVDLDQLQDQVNEQFVDLIDENLLKVNSNELWLELELNSNILFPTASADPSLQAKGIFEEIASMFSSYNNPVQVEGFTDDVPINNRQFKSNWELSAARAASVVKLLANNGVKPERLSAVGRGEFKPVADNGTAEGRAKNRRVVVMISKVSNERPRIDSGDVEQIVSPVVETDLANQDPGTINDLLQEAPATSPIENLPPEPVVKPIELNNGGLLFTSDPLLPRNNGPRNNTPRDNTQLNSTSTTATEQTEQP
jgi:chemotaxis protein MotB